MAELIRSPQNLLHTFENTLSEWEVLGRRAQLNAVLPLLDILLQSKVGYADLVKMLAKNGLDVTPAALRQAIHRWRTKQAELPPTVIPAALEPETPIATTQMPAPAQNELPSIEGMPKKASLGSNVSLTKERLQEMRKEHIDLDELVRSAKKL